MKKIYTLILSVMTVGVVGAQVNPNLVTKTRHTPATKAKKPGTTATNVQKAVVAGPFTFSNMETWTTADNAGSGDNWVVGTAAPQGFYSDGMGAIASTTAANNFAMFDSDFLGEDDNGTSPQDADIFYATSIDLTGIPAVAVEFESYYRAYVGSCYVIASTDGVNWTQVQVHDDVDVNASTANPATVTANVSSIIGNSPTAYIGFRYIGTWDYAWMVDDVKIVTLPDNDLGLIKGWHGDILNSYEYSMIPLAQSREIVAGVVVENQGGQAQNVTVTCEVNDGSGVVATTTQALSSAVGAKDTLWFNTGYTPSANGSYDVTFSIPADEETSDDTYTTSELMVNDDLMAHDYGAVDPFGWASTNDNADEPHSWGNLYEMESDQLLKGVDVNFATGTTPGLYFLIRVQHVDPLGQGDYIQDPMDLLAQVDYTVDAADIGSAITTIELPTPVTLQAGELYMIDILKVDGTTGASFYIGGSDTNLEDDDFSSIGYGPYGQGSAVNYYISWGFAPYVRANFDPTLNVEEEALTGVSVYPNPSEGVVNVTNDNNLTNTIEVFDVTGKTVLSKVVSTETTFDLSGNGSGVYIVKVSNEAGSLVERVVIK
jgi:hypothetical protein